MYRCFAVLAALVFSSVPRADSLGAPTGWTLAGSRPQDYSVGVDREELAAGGASAFLQSIGPAAEGFGTLLQVISADPWRGKRLRLTALVKASEVRGWAGVWMRVDGPGLMIVLDNMRDRPILGNTDWNAYSLVLDVPSEASTIAYGVLLEGPGRIWMDEFELESVDTGVSATADPIYRPVTVEHNDKDLEVPVNLDFEA